MKEPLWERIKQWMCRRFGHREVYSEVSRSVSCTRCRLLLRGPLQMGPGYPGEKG